MSQELFPAIFTAIFLVIVLAAIMSTADSLLILASSAVVRDVVQKIFHPDLSERRLSLYGKLTTVVIGAGALILAVGEVRMIFWFVLFAWSGLASAFTPVILCSLFWGGTTRAGALAGMVGGFLSTVVWVLFFKEQFYDLYEMIPGFLVGFLLTVGVSLATEPPEGAAEELQQIRASLR
jgi:sodium/proline symporter